jgi:hypothetical protein
MHALSYRTLASVSRPTSVAHLRRTLPPASASARAAWLSWLPPLLPPPPPQHPPLTTPSYPHAGVGWGTAPRSCAQRRTSTAPSSRYGANNAPPASRRPTRDDVSHPPGPMNIPQVKDALRKMTHIETLSGANAYKCDKCVRTPCSRVAPSSFLRSPLHSRLSHTSLVPVHLPPPLSLAPASESV